MGWLKIKNSIVFKTVFIIVSALFIVMSMIGLYIQDSQSNIINKLQSYQQNYISQKLKDAKNKEVKKELDILNILSTSISGVIASSLYNGDDLIAKTSLKKFLIKENIKAIYSYNKLDDEIFWIAYKIDKKLIISKYLPVYFKTLQSLQFELIYEDENVGYIKIYYDNTKINKELTNIRKIELQEFKTQSLEIKNEVDKELIYQIISFIMGGLLIVFIIIFLLLQLVNKPLSKFQHGLDSFFNYLADPSKKVEPININTTDEFGQMTKSVNRSIQISMTMHQKIANLMRVMDKNVISSETDDKGIITYVSQAFCDISGYTKEELLGKQHNIIRHPDMPKEIFKDLWNILKSGKSWEGEVKNLKKDGGFYWVHAIITPKCTKAGASRGYTAIRYDITAKKEVEDLTINLEVKIEERTEDLNIAKKEIEATHKHTRESIKYASLIQGAVVSSQEDMIPFFKDLLVHWEPKDTVGGDIWLFSELRHKDECLLLFIDCTGHGVPGAFVTMIVKALEREIVSNLKKHPQLDISPAEVMRHFNKTMKVLLKQETKNSISNAGWEGGVIYYNRRTQILKFAGAETPLFYMTNDNEFKTVKGNRYSVGYKKCDMDYKYQETIIEVKEGMKFYCTTDGYIDQNGGEKDFPFGKKRFTNIIKENHTLPMEKLKTIFINEMGQYEKVIENNDRNDDITVIAFEIGKQSDFIENTDDEIIKYKGVITQNVIGSCMDNIEAKITNISMMSALSTITIEFCQNMMFYSKNKEDGSREIVPAGEIEVKYIDQEYYKITATNIVSIDDKKRIEPILNYIQTLDKAEIKKRYKELRRSGENTHAKGGGIGMYEIAKASSSIDFDFTSVYNYKKINKDKFYFTMKSMIKTKIKGN